MVRIDVYRFNSNYLKAIQYISSIASETYNLEVRYAPLDKDENEYLLTIIELDTEYKDEETKKINREKTKLIAQWVYEWKKANVLICVDSFHVDSKSTVP